ncbi:MAG: hypothetical protein N2255_03450, partial [Kiritimatiellae bacterium]|nr:hypothetical protein [Kiritimatiellia bacterium]
TIQCRRGETRNALVSVVDCLPTIADLAGCSLPRGGYGKSLVPLLADPGAKIHDAVFAEIDYRTMIRTERLKMVVNSKGTVLKLYDMLNDPTESLNLVGRDDMDGAICELRDRLLLWHLETPNRLE